MFTIYKNDSTTMSSPSLKVLTSILDVECLEYQIVNENRKTLRKGDMNSPVVVIKETEEVIPKNYKDLVKYLETNGLVI